VVVTADVDGTAAMAATGGWLVDGADVVAVSEIAVADRAIRAARREPGVTAGLAPGCCAGMEVSGATSATRRSATCRCAPGDAPAIPTTTTAHPPATITAADVTATRPKLMRPVCQMGLM
jgi:hypothetical protein